MRRVILACAMLLVLGSTTLVQADVMDLREPSFPGAGAGEDDPKMTFNMPGDAANLIGKGFWISFATMSFYR